MNIEIERRFLVNKNNFIPPEKYNSIEQVYLIFDSNQILRVRKTNDKYQIGYKFKKSNIHRLEFEYDIPPDDGKKLLSLSKYHLIKKNRYYIDIEQHTWEIDVFMDLNKGLIIAEIELENEDEEIKFPTWVDKEISYDDKYLNFNLSQNPYSLWENHIDKE